MCDRNCLAHLMAAGGRRIPIVLLCIGVTGCATLPSHKISRRPLPLPAAMAAYYTYPNHAPQADVKFVRDQKCYREFLVQFPLSVEGFEPTEPMVEFEWLESTAPGRRPAILVNPILGGEYPLERAIARYFAAHGFHAALVHRKSPSISSDHPLSRIEVVLRQGLIRIRQVVDWMAANERVDSARLGCFGISMGGIASASAAAVEPRFRAHVVALAGGSISDVLTTSHDRLLARPRARYLAQTGLTREQLKAQLDRELRSDPLQLAPYVDPQKLLMFIAVFDRTIGHRPSFQLREALGFPQTIFLPFGHYTSYVCLPYFKRRSLAYFRAKLDE